LLPFFFIYLESKAVDDSLTVASPLFVKPTGSAVYVYGACQQHEHPVLYNPFTYVITDVESEVTMRKLKCLRCEHEWIPRTVDVRQCPKCKSAFWNVPKKASTKE
jgi:hypothetical protein